MSFMDAHRHSGWQLKHVFGVSKRGESAWKYGRCVHKIVVVDWIMEMISSMVLPAS